MYTLTYNNKTFEFQTLDQALVASKNLVVDWAIFDPNGNKVFDWMDRIGP